jgi:mycothiol synthase
VSIEVRAPGVDEAPALTEFLDEHAQATFGESELSEEEVRRWFALPGIWMRIADFDGSPAGYVDVYRRDESTRFEVDVRALELESAEALLAAAEKHARENSGAVLHGYAQGADPVVRDAFARGGWRPIRHSFLMRLELRDPPAEPSWPEGISVRTARPGEEERIYEAHMDAFADHWDHRRQIFAAWRAETVEHPRFDPSLWWLAEDGSELAGLSLNSWHVSGDPEFGWVAVLGVRPLWRRRGLGLALLQQSFLDFHRRGAKRVGLGVDAENPTGAVRLYERAGMTVVRRNDTYEKKL